MMKKEKAKKKKTRGGGEEGQKGWWLIPPSPSAYQQPCLPSLPPRFVVLVVVPDGAAQLTSGLPGMAEKCVWVLQSGSGGSKSSSEAIASEPAAFARRR